MVANKTYSFFSEKYVIDFDVIKASLFNKGKQVESKSQIKCF